MMGFLVDPCRGDAASYLAMTQGRNRDREA